MVGECQAAVAETVATFGKIDILLGCTSQGMRFPPFDCSKRLLTWCGALVGTVEELAASQQTLNLVRDQFEINYFGPLNIIKAALPHMRRQKLGHVMIISGISKALPSC